MLVKCLRLVLFLCVIAADIVSGMKLVVMNKNAFPIWVGTRETTDLVQAGGGFKVNPSQTRQVELHQQWDGTFGALPICKSDNETICNVGTCGNRQECTENFGTQPMTLLQISKGYKSFETYYTVSLVNGFNMKVSMFPFGGRGNCPFIECNYDINTKCPEPLRAINHLRETVACHSSCGKFNTEEYCCTGNYNVPTACTPSEWKVNSAILFKEHCPDAYSYTLDDDLKVQSCTNATGFTITFG